MVEPYALHGTATGHRLKSEVFFVGRDEMHVSEKKKNEYWNHFVANAFTGALEIYRKPPGVTGSRLRKLKPKLWQDDDFWWDIVSRHGGNDVTPEEMRYDDPAQYEHCLGNFWSMIIQDLHEMGFSV